MTRSLLIFCVACLLLAACQQARARTGVGMNRVEIPLWARTGKHPDFPARTHLVAFGLAPTRAAAEARAVAGLEEEIVTHALAMDLGALNGTQFGKLVQDRANWFDVSEFGDSVRSDLATTGFEFVAARAIHRGDVALRAKGMIEAAREAMANAPELASLGDLGQRVDASSRAFLAAARLLALRLLADGSLDRTALERAESAALATYELPSLARIEQTGVGQNAALQGGLAQPLGLRAALRGSPLAKAPIRWSCALGLRGALDGSTQTDETGAAQCRVLQVAPTGDEFGYIQCQLDIDRMTPRRTGISMPAWMWRLTLPCRRNTELVVKVNETIDGKAEGFERSFLPGLQKWCLGRSLTVVLDKPSTAEFAYRIRIEGEIAVATWKQGELPLARASGKVSLKNDAHGSILYEWTPGMLREGKPGNTAESQALIVLREVSAEGLAEFCTRLLATAPAPNEEFTKR